MKDIVTRIDEHLHNLNKKSDPILNIGDFAIFEYDSHYFLADVVKKDEAKKAVGVNLRTCEIVSGALGGDSYPRCEFKTNKNYYIPTGSLYRNAILHNKALDRSSVNKIQDLFTQYKTAVKSYQKFSVDVRLKTEFDGEKNKNDISLQRKYDDAVKKEKDHIKTYDDIQAACYKFMKSLV